MVKYVIKVHQNVIATKRRFEITLDNAQKRLFDFALYQMEYEDYSQLSEEELEIKINHLYTQLLDDLNRYHVVNLGDCDLVIEEE